jgi:hypothetical protein
MTDRTEYSPARALHRAFILYVMRQQWPAKCAGALFLRIGWSIVFLKNQKSRRGNKTLKLRH